MKGHLSHEELTGYLLGEFDGAGKEHLEGCLECRHELEALGRSLTMFKNWVHEQASARGDVQVLVMTKERQEHRREWLSIAVLAALVIVAVLLMVAGRGTQAVQSGGAASQVDADDALLMEVQRDLEREVPDALAPAVMLTAERNRMIQKTKVQNQ